MIGLVAVAMRESVSFLRLERLTVSTERARTVSAPISIRRCLNSPEIFKSYPTRNFIS